MSSSSRRYIFIAVAAVLILFSISMLTLPHQIFSAHAASNLVSNGDFETGSLTGWTCDAGNKVISSPVHSGSYALQENPTSSTTGQCTQNISVQASTAYVLSAYVDGPDAYLGINSGTSNWLSSTNYTQLTVNFTTSSSQTSATIYVHGWYGLGSVAVDDVVLSGPAGSSTPTATPTPGKTATPTSGSTVTATPTPTPTPGSTPTPNPTGTPSPVSFSQTQIDAAVAAPLLAFDPPTTANSGRPGDNAKEVDNAAAFYFMGLVFWYNPNATTSSGASVAKRFVASIGNVITGGNEPDANGGLEGWGHNDTAQALLLARNEPTIWNALSSAQQSKVNLLMQALAVTGNYNFNDVNNFKQDLDYALEGGECKFNKTNNPNYREGYLNVLIAASQYFGASTLNSFFTSFDYTTFTAQLKSAGFTNILTAWSGDETLLMSGGSDNCSGSGKGVREAFTYSSVPLSNPAGIFNKLAVYTYQGAVTSTGAGGKAYIADNTTSPYQGQTGMEEEFATTDSDGARSDALYAFEGWMNSITSRTTMTVLGNWGCGTTQTNDIKLEAVGSGDLLYKLAHGYEGYYLGQNRLVNETTPTSDGPSAKGFYFDQQIWTLVLSKVQAC